MSGPFAKGALFTALGLVTAACDAARSEPVQQPGAWETLADDEVELAQALRKPLAQDSASVHTQLKITSREAETTPGNKPYAYFVHDRTIDCGTGAFTTASIIYYGADGAVVEEHFEGRKQSPMQDNPGSRGAYYTLSMCELAGLPTPVLPYISLVDVALDDWRLMGTEADGAKVSVVPSSVRHVDDTETIIARAQFPKPRPIGDGRDYTTVVYEAYFTCDAPRINVVSSDYYGANGEVLAAEVYDVVIAWRTPGRETAQRIRDVACAGPGQSPKPVRSPR